MQRGGRGGGVWRGGRGCGGGRSSVGCRGSCSCDRICCCCWPDNGVRTLSMHDELRIEWLSLSSRRHAGNRSAAHTRAARCAPCSALATAEDLAAQQHAIGAGECRCSSSSGATERCRRGRRARCVCIGMRRVRDGDPVGRGVFLHGVVVLSQAKTVAGVLQVAAASVRDEPVGHVESRSDLLERAQRRRDAQRARRGRRGRVQRGSRGGR